MEVKEPGFCSVTISTISPPSIFLNSEVEITHMVLIRPDKRAHFQLTDAQENMRKIRVISC